MDVCEPNFGSYSGPGGGQGSGGGSSSSPLNLTGEFRAKIDGRIINHSTEALAIGQTYQVKADLTAHGADTEDWMETGKETVEAEIQVRIGSGSWAHVTTVHIPAVDLDQGDTAGESGNYTIPNTQGQSISFRVKTNTTREAYEYDYSDNTSGVKTYQVTQGNTDPIVPIEWIIPSINLILN